MSSRAAWILGAGLCLCAPAASADLYRWTDESGTIHFAETCPEGVRCTRVPTLPPQPVADREVAAPQPDEQAAERALRAQQETEQRDAIRQEQRRRDSAAAACESLFAEREILELTLPVYRDDQQQLHYRDSLHHHGYQGERHYLADQERAEQLARVRQEIAKQCTGVNPARASYVQRFRFPPLLTEVLGLLDEMLYPQGPQPEEVCAFARVMLQDEQTMHSGLPSRDVRELQRLVEQRCR
jgi:hypothetical protein